MLGLGGRESQDRGYIWDSPCPRHHAGSCRSGSGLGAAFHAVGMSQRQQKSLPGRLTLLPARQCPCTGWAQCCPPMPGWDAQKAEPPAFRDLETTRKSSQPLSTGVPGAQTPPSRNPSGCTVLQYGHLNSLLLHNPWRQRTLRRCGVPYTGPEETEVPAPTGAAGPGVSRQEYQEQCWFHPRSAESPDYSRVKGTWGSM